MQKKKIGIAKKNILPQQKTSVEKPKKTSIKKKAIAEKTVNNHSIFPSSTTPTGRDLLNVFFKYPVQEIPCIVNHNFIQTLQKENLFAPAEEENFLKSTLKSSTVFNLATKSNDGTFFQQLEIAKPYDKNTKIPFLFVTTKFHLSEIPHTGQTNTEISEYDKTRWQGTTIRFRIATAHNFLLQFRPATRLAVSELQQILDGLRTSVFCLNCKLSLIYSNASAQNFLETNYSSKTNESPVKNSAARQKQNNFATSVTNFDKKQSRNTGNDLDLNVAVNNFVDSCITTLVSSDNLTQFAKRTPKSWNTSFHHFAAKLIDTEKSTKTKTFVITRSNLESNSASTLTFRITLKALELTQHHAWLIELNHA